MSADPYGQVMTRNSKTLLVERYRANDVGGLHRHQREMDTRHGTVGALSVVQHGDHSQTVIRPTMGTLGAILHRFPSNG
ncbi:hypothetical protein [Saccharomonospora viridis]|uniref:hypothetical protein n=2 Tax=Saccharomonospora viridis TaxID=1852 RepID=UPI0024A7DC09|nr:hypothetical protein [Saccharomonospora viridis]